LARGFWCGFSEDAVDFKHAGGGGVVQGGWCRGGSRVGGVAVVPRWAKSSRRFCYVLRFFSFYMLIWLLSENAGKDEEGIQLFLEENRGKQEA
jgi:hypothetical protein